MINSYTEMHDFMVSIIGNVPYGIIVIDLEGYITVLNQQAHQILQLTNTPQHHLETNILEILNDIVELQELMSTCIKKGRITFQLQEHPVHDQYLTITGKPILSGFLLTLNNVTQTKQAQDEATLALLNGQEMERRRLSKEMHDGIGPLMSTIRLNLDAVKKDLKDVSEKTKQKVETMSDLIKEVANDIRSISHALMPSALIDFGVVRALHNLCEKANKSELINIHFYHAVTTDRLPQNIELCLYRVGQELLSNSLKYAQAKEINIQLVQRNDKIILTVEDDGVGFDTFINSSVSEGIGLQNIYTRVYSLNGQFIIDSQPKKGVHSTVEIPL